MTRYAAIQELWQAKCRDRDEARRLAHGRDLLASWLIILVTVGLIGMTGCGHHDKTLPPWMHRETVDGIEYTSGTCSAPGIANGISACRADGMCSCVGSIPRETERIR